MWPHPFVKELAKVLSLAIAKAPDFEAGGRLSGFLHVPTTSEDSLFQRAFRELGVPPEEYAGAQPVPTALAFRDFLIRLCHEGTFEEILTALYVTEGTYLDWASRLIQQGKRPQNWLYQEWIDAHSPTALGEFVGWMKGWLDEREVGERRQRLAYVFLTTLRYEYMFWEMAYNGEKWPDE